MVEQVLSPWVPMQRGVRRAAAEDGLSASSPGTHLLCHETGQGAEPFMLYLLGWYSELRESPELAPHPLALSRMYSCCPRRGLAWPQLILQPHDA